MPRSPTAAFLTLTVVFFCNTAIGTDLAMAGSANEQVKASGVPSSVVATEKKPATVQVPGGSAGDGAALEVTARPIGGDASSPPYLVGVFVAGGQSENAAPKLLGSFSFFPVRAGEAQTFIIPKPEAGDMSLAKDLTLSIKLIPANPARDIKDAAVEILGARVVK